MNLNHFIKSITELWEINLPELTVTIYTPLSGAELLA